MYQSHARRPQDRSRTQPNRGHGRRPVASLMESLENRTHFSVAGAEQHVRPGVHAAGQHLPGAELRQQRLGQHVDRLGRLLQVLQPLRQVPPVRRRSIGHVGRRGPVRLRPEPELSGQLDARRQRQRDDQRRPAGQPVLLRPGPRLLGRRPITACSSTTTTPGSTLGTARDIGTTWGQGSDKFWPYNKIFSEDYLDYRDNVDYVKFSMEAPGTISLRMKDFTYTGALVAWMQLLDAQRQRPDRHVGHGG